MTQQGIQTPEQKVLATKLPRPDWHQPEHPRWQAFCNTGKPLTEKDWREFKEKSVDSGG